MRVRLARGLFLPKSSLHVYVRSAVCLHARKRRSCSTSQSAPYKVDARANEDDLAYLEPLLTFFALRFPIFSLRFSVLWFVFPHFYSFVAPWSAALIPAPFRVEEHFRVRGCGLWRLRRACKRRLERQGVLEGRAECLQSWLGVGAWLKAVGPSSRRSWARGLWRRTFAEWVG